MLAWPLQLQQSYVFFLCSFFKMAIEKNLGDPRRSGTSCRETRDFVRQAGLNAPTTPSPLTPREHPLNPTFTWVG